MHLTEEELILILVQALVQARKLKSGLASDERPKIHVALQGSFRKKEPVVVYSDEGASDEHKRLAQLKSSVSVKHSKNDLAMTSHSVGHSLGMKNGRSTLSHAGGVPLYKQGTLVGSVGISGDLPEIDEEIAHAAANGFSAPASIRSDKVLNIPYHSSSSVSSIGSLPPLPSPKTLSRPSTPRASSKSSESPSVGSLPPLRSSVSMKTLPSLPVISSPPTPSSLPPLPVMSPSTPSSALPPLPVNPNSPLPVLKTKVSTPKSSPKLPELSPKRSPLPPLKAGSSLSSLAPSGFTSNSSSSINSTGSGMTGTSTIKLPVLPPSPQQLSNRATLPPLSKLTPLK